jgi:hypothetical protein
VYPKIKPHHFNAHILIRVIQHINSKTPAPFSLHCSQNLLGFLDFRQHERALIQGLRVLGWRTNTPRRKNQSLAPEQLYKEFFRPFKAFLALFAPEKMLLAALISTVSMCAEVIYGQRCGHR